MIDGAATAPGVATKRHPPLQLDASVEAMLDDGRNFGFTVGGLAVVEETDPGDEAIVEASLDVISDEVLEEIQTARRAWGDEP